MNKILITGGAGFIGARLATRLLADDYQIDLVDNLSRGRRDKYLLRLLDHPKVRFFNRDLPQPDVLDDLGDDYQYIYHLAAIIGVSNVLQRPYDVLKNNAAMTFTLLSLAARQKNLERFVFTSTSEVYAGTLHHFSMPIPTPESTPLALTDIAHPRASYMLSKIHGEALCMHSGTPFTIIRPHNIYGPRMGMAHVIPELLRKAFHAPEDGDLEVYSVDHQRTFCHVDDAVEILKFAAETPGCRDQTLNMGNQQPEITMGELAKFILRATGRDLPITPLPATPGSPRRRCPDMSKTKALTGYEARVGLEQGIASTFAWYRDNVFVHERLATTTKNEKTATV